MYKIPITFYISCGQIGKVESHQIVRPKQWKVFAAKNYLIFWVTREQSASSDGQAWPILDIGDENTQPFMAGAIHCVRFFLRSEQSKRSRWGTV